MDLKSLEKQRTVISILIVRRFQSISNFSIWIEYDSSVFESNQEQKKLDKIWLRTVLSNHKFQKKLLNTLKTTERELQMPMMVKRSLVLISLPLPLISNNGLKKQNENLRKKNVRTALSIPKWTTTNLESKLKGKVKMKVKPRTEFKKARETSVLIFTNLLWSRDNNKRDLTRPQKKSSLRRMQKNLLSIQTFKRNQFQSRMLQIRSTKDLWWTTLNECEKLERKKNLNEQWQKEVMFPGKCKRQWYMQLTKLPWNQRKTYIIQRNQSVHHELLKNQHY